MSPEIEHHQEDEPPAKPEMEQPMQPQPATEDDKQSDLDVPGGKGLVKE